MSDLWFISDIGGEYLLTRDFAWCPLSSVTEGSLTITREALIDAAGEGYVWCLYSHKEAQAFCNGYRACGSFAVPIKANLLLDALLRSPTTEE